MQSQASQSALVLSLNMRLLFTLVVLCTALHCQVDGAELESLDNEAQLQGNLARKFFGKVIYIESYRYRGHWLSSARKHWASFDAVAEEDVVDTMKVKWRIRDVGGGAIAIESVQHPRMYVDAHHTGWCKLSYSSYPRNQNWAKFVMEMENGQYMIRSVRYPQYRLDAHHTKWAAFAKGKGIYAKFRIYQPPMANHWELVYRLNNAHGRTDVSYTYMEKVGISRTNGREISASISAEIGGEIFAAFSVGLSLSTTWKHYNSVTYSKETSHAVTFKVKPGYIGMVYQLVGTYGHYRVRAKGLKIVQRRARSQSYQIVYASGMDAYNRGEFLHVANHGPGIDDVGSIEPPLEK